MVIINFTEDSFTYEIITRKDSVTLLKGGFNEQTGVFGVCRTRWPAKCLEMDWGKYKILRRLYPEPGDGGQPDGRRSDRRRKSRLIAKTVMEPENIEGGSYQSPYDTAYPARARAGPYEERGRFRPPFHFCWFEQVVTGSFWLWFVTVLFFFIVASICDSLFSLLIPLMGPLLLLIFLVVLDCPGLRR